MVTMPGDYSEELVEPTRQDYQTAATVYLEALNDRVPPDPNAPPEWPWSMRPEFRAAVDAAFAAGQRAILAALSSSGRLVPEGSEVREEWTMRYKLNGKPECAEDNGHVFDSREEAVRHIDAWRRFFPALMYSDVEYLRRGGITTPWTPAVDE